MAYLAIAGNLGSGKTTVAKLIADNLGWVYLPTNRPELKYMEDLFNDPQRWSFETQIRFLSSKAENIQNAFNQNLNIVLDRSIYEDADIFAYYFHSKNNFNDRAFDTYTSVANYFIDTLPAPDLIIYCTCHLNSALKRIQSRQSRSFEKLYPNDYIDDLDSLYQEWINNFDSCPVYQLNTDQYNIQESPEELAMFLSDIETLFNNSSFQYYQDSLFNSNIPQPQKYLKILDSINDIPLLPQKYMTFSSAIMPHKPALKKKQVYIAAPFTQYAVHERAKQESLLLFNELPHGIIAPGKYRESLVNISKAFNKLGMKGFLPHRDINKWGDRILMPEDIVTFCETAVAASDLFLGIFSNSTGVHFEAGLALALNKPIIIINIPSMSESLFATGIGKMENAIVLNADNLDDVPTQINSTRVQEFLAKLNLN